jgi:hypothetical protein
LTPIAGALVGHDLLGERPSGRVPRFLEGNPIKPWVITRSFQDGLDGLYEHQLVCDVRFVFVEPHHIALVSRAVEWQRINVFWLIEHRQKFYLKAIERGTATISFRRKRGE